jgi:hypothetical protein
MTTDLSPEARTLLDAGRVALGPTGAERARIRAGVGARVAAATAGGVAAAGATGIASAASGAAVAAAGGAKAILVAVAVAGIGAGGGVAVWRATHHTDPVQAKVEAPRSGAAGVVSTPSQPLHGHVPPATAAPAGATAAPAPVLAPVRPGRDVRSPASRSSVPALGPELSLLDDARRALDRRDPSAALAAIDSYFQQTGRQLEREAVLLRARALCASGRADVAEQTIAAARARWPALVAPCSRGTP